MSRPGILFDLDGTLADTAPDLVAALNRLLAEAGRPPMPFAIARNEVSNGAVGLLRLGFGLDAKTSVDTGLRAGFLDLYERIGHLNSRLFIPLQSIIDTVTQVNGAWGVVTNKPAVLTQALLRHLGVAELAAVVVSGDTLPQRKPHPAPLLHAAAQLEIEPADCVYLGDAVRDIEAGRAAGMRTVATTYGYIRPGDDVRSWGADVLVDHPRKIAPMLLGMLGAS